MTLWWSHALTTNSSKQVGPSPFSCVSKTRAFNVRYICSVDRHRTSSTWPTVPAYMCFPTRIVNFTEPLSRPVWVWWVQRLEFYKKSTLFKSWLFKFLYFLFKDSIQYFLVFSHLCIGWNAICQSYNLSFAFWITS